MGKGYQKRQLFLRSPAASAVYSGSLLSTRKVAFLFVRHNQVCTLFCSSLCRIFGEFGNCKKCGEENKAREEKQKKRREDWEMVKRFGKKWFLERELGEETRDSKARASELRWVYNMWY
jgi:hypothetical protein